MLRFPLPLYTITQLLSLCLFLSSCSRQNEPILTTFSGIAMTMPYRIVVGADLNRGQQQRAKEIIEDTFDEVDAVYNHWNPLSEISYLNALPAHVDFPLSQEMYVFLQQVDGLVRSTRGGFDPTVAALVSAWKQELDNGRFLPYDEVIAAKEKIGWEGISFKDGVFRKEKEGIQLDFGGVAKGYAIDLLLERLSNEEWGGIYVEWGGEVAAVGSHPSGRPWCVCISRFGENDHEQAIAWVFLDNQALATSGDYFQWWEVNGEKWTHIIDPTTGYPLQIERQKLGSTSVLAHSCLVADALATAAMVWQEAKVAEAHLRTLQKQGLTIEYWLCDRNGTIASSSEKT